MTGIEGPFRAAWTGGDDPATVGVELLPVRLALACQRVLPVDGVGIGVFGEEFRVPLAASSAAAGRAEQLQFTLGEGPCLHALHSNTPVGASAQGLQRRWPLYFAQLVERTPYRAVVCLPVRMNSHTSLALDLYLDQSHLRGVDLANAAVVANQVLDVLQRTQSALSSRWEEAGWLQVPPARSRLNVWVAIGMLNVVLDLAPRDALPVLRAYAVAHQQTLDEVAAALVTRTLSAEQLQA